MAVDPPPTGPGGPRRSARWARGAASAALVVGAASALLAASLGWWADRAVLDTDTWVARTAPLASDPAVQAALAEVLTDQVVDRLRVEEVVEALVPDRAGLRGRTTVAVQGLIGEELERLLRSDAFAEVWEQAVREAHATAVAVARGEERGAVGAADGVVSLDLLPLVDLVLDVVAPAVVDLIGDRSPPIPLEETTVQARLDAALADAVGADLGRVVVFDDDVLVTAQRAVELFDALLPVTAVATALLAALAIAVSPRRMRTALALAVAVALVVVVVRRVALRLEADLVARASTPVRADGVEAGLDAFLSPFLAASGRLLLGTVLVAVGLAAAGLATHRPAPRAGPAR